MLILKFVQKNGAPSIQRHGTMEATAEEGIAYLKAQHADSLIQVDKIV